MNIIVVSTQNNQKEFQEKGTNFGELLEELEPSGKFVDFQFVYNGNLLQNIAKGTKLATICQGKGGCIVIQRKALDQQPTKQYQTNPQPIYPSPFAQPQNQQQSPSNTQQDQKSSSIQQAEQPSKQQNSIWDTVQQPQIEEKQQVKTGVPSGSSSQIRPLVGIPIASPFIKPVAVAPGQSPFAPPSVNSSGSNPFAPTQNSTTISSKFQTNPPPNIITPQIPKFSQPPNPSQIVIQPQTQTLRKTVTYRSQINDEQKIISDYKIKITDKGNRVELENEKYDMKVVFLEENANEKIQGEIKKQLTKDAYPQDIKLLVKCLVGEQNQSTKVLFKKNFDGLAIQWATGLVTLFDFDLSI